VAAFALFSATCSGTADDEAVRCSALRAFRVEPGGCLVRAETGMRSCLPDADEQHWGMATTCAVSPEGDLYVVTIPHGAEVVGDTGWSVPTSIDAGLSEACLAALANGEGCDTTW
jgi:hypothetical protein